MAAEPKYQRIADALRAMIESGQLAPGARLPTEIELMAQHGASRNTVRDATKLLTTRGLVEARAGEGTFVAEKINPFVTAINVDLEDGFGADDGTYVMEVTARRRRPEALLPQVEIHRASDARAPELRLPGDAQVVSRRQRRFIDGKPWSIQTSFYPRAFVVQGAGLLSEPEDITNGAVRYIQETCGIELAGWEDKYKVRAPDEIESTFFNLPSDGRISVIENRQTGFDETNKPFVLTVTAYPADRNEFVINVGKVPAADQ
jgi:GntR family transcriptional regulator